MFHTTRDSSALHLSKQMKYCPMLVQWRGNESKTALFGSTMSALWEKIFILGVSAITRLYFKLRNQLYCPFTQTVLHSLKICHNYCLLYPFKSITRMIIINYDAAQYVGLKKTLFNITKAMYYITLHTYFLHIQIALEYTFRGIFFSSHVRWSVAVKIKLFLHQQCCENLKSHVTF